MEDKEKSKSISLRKKRTVRPKISGPKPLLPGAQPLSKPQSQNDTTPDQKSQLRPRDPATNTADLVKRRYSTRFNQVEEGLAPPVPALPGASVPGSRDGKLPGSSEGKKVEVDLKALGDPNFRSEQYVAEIFAEASEQDILNYQQELRRVQKRNSTTLQQNVYENRAGFVKVSKEADKLKAELRSLRLLMSDLTTTMNEAVFSSTSPSNAVADRKTANRSSVANLEALWGSQLQTLWKRIEGSQKYLPAIQGRHIIWESSKWVELNTATWKPRRRIHLIMLNDHLLVAHEKKRLDASASNKEGKQKYDKAQLTLVAERCWPLQDIEIVDIASRPMPSKLEHSSRVSNTVNIRAGPDSLTYAVRGIEASEKTALLVNFRKMAEELRRTIHAEIERREQPRHSVEYFATRDPQLMKQTNLVQGLSQAGSQHKSSIMIEVDGKQQSIRWVEGQIDDLDMDIALQRFDQAVNKLERLKKIAKGIKNNSLARGIVEFKTKERANRLASLLIRDLVDTHALQSVTQQHVEWLVRLGFEDRAREAYLSARSQVIKKRTRQCVFEGDLPQYIYQLSFVYFTIIRNTMSVYQRCFPPVMTSACVKWAKEHVDDFNDVLARQLSSFDQSSDMWKECMETAHRHDAMLGEVGLNFRHLIGRERSLDENLDEDGDEDVGLGL